jgi:ATP-dependent DNA helicase DinG
VNFRARPAPQPAAAAPGDPVPRVRAQVAAAFAPGGALAGAIGGYCARDAQRDMALAVFDTIAERGTLVAEAGTGTGKTFAYLVPALLAGGKVLISTGTKALQDQVFSKDLAAVTRALGVPVQLALLKGRQNYVCLHRLQRAEVEGLLPTRQDAGHLRSVVRFAATSATGDRAELAAVPEHAGVWPLVTSTRENCLGQECPRFDGCFVMKARREALAADIVVVNHHLFLADLALRDDAIRDFLPAADTVILDEAHQLPKIASDFFGRGFSLAQLHDLALDCKAIGLAQARDGADWVRLTAALEQAARALRLALADAGLAPNARLALDRLPQRAALPERLLAIDAALLPLRAAVQACTGRAVELDALAPRLDALHAELRLWRDAAARLVAAPAQAAGTQVTPATPALEDEQAQWVRWVATSPHGAQFHATPLAPGEAFARLRAQQTQAWILTSATLTLAGRFDEYLAEVGLPQATTRRWDSPFDFARQGLLYLPQPMPSPQSSDFPEQVAEAAWPLIEASGGRAFVLCSTLRAVDRVAQVLQRKIEQHDHALPLLVQGTSTRRALIDSFRRAGNAILVGSVSFWEGIDVRGEALSLVVIDKLPFAPPDDPVIEARSRRLKSLGRNPFTEYQLPLAVTLLKQGAGRLIRDERDRGVLALMDERVLSKSYGRTVLASLPPFARTRSVEAACGFFALRPGE